MVCVTRHKGGGRRVSARVGQSVRQRRLAAELKKLRELSLLTADEVAQRLGWSPSKVSRVENARIRLKPGDVDRLLGVYEVAGDQRDTLLSLAEEDGHKKWWDAYADILPPELLALISFEAEASKALWYEPMVVPGLLQTEPYARRVIGMWQEVTSVSPIELERRVEVRMTRQRIIASRDPLDLTAVIDEGVLRRQIDDRAVMREQLNHLAHIARLPNVELRVLPLSGRHVISAGPLISLRVPDFGDIVYIEHFLDGLLYIEDATLIYHFQLVFEQLRNAALSPEESVQLISATAEELWTPGTG
jgi:transcriptional regulator with XRE-family HTH domain